MENPFGWEFSEPGKPLQKKSLHLQAPNKNQVLIKIAGCGLCHTDISFFSGQVKTRHIPLVLGHEISGTIIDTGPESKADLGKKVIVPAVIPCGVCDICQKGRGNVCSAQKMPGNDFDGGFASHLLISNSYLAYLPEGFSEKEFPLESMAVIADAVTTPYQSLLRSGLKSGETAIVIGIGGIGIYMVQHALNRGARVIALDIDPSKCKNAELLGAHHTLHTRGLDEKEIKNKIKGVCLENNFPNWGWKIFECSGTSQGQLLGFNLLNPEGTLGIIGFTMDKLNIRLSNLMAFDGDIFGNWGCHPDLYPEVIESVLSGRVKVGEFTEVHPLEEINSFFMEPHSHITSKRIVFKP